MNKYNTVLQILAIFTVIFIIYLLYCYVVGIVRKNRLKDFSLKLIDYEVSSGFVYFIVSFFSVILESMVIFNNLAKSYDRYIIQDKTLKKGMDFVSLKIILGICLIVLYVFITFLYKGELNALIILVTFILGFIIPDFYCFYLESKNKVLVNRDLLKAIIVMNNSLKANRSPEQSICDVITRVDGPVKIEFTRVLNDIRLAIKISDAFKRMYDRTNIKVVLTISQNLSLLGKSSSNLVDVFDSLESDLLEDEKQETEISVIKGTNNLAFIIYIILPVIFFFYLLSSNESYLNLILDERGILVMLTILILYIFYILILWKVVKGVRSND